MTEANRKYSVTQDEIDSAVEQCRTPLESSSPTQEMISHRWNIVAGTGDLIGLHIRANQAFLTLVDKKLELTQTQTIKAGFEQMEKLFQEVSRVTFRVKGSVLTVVTLSGKHTHFSITKSPNASRSVLVKGFLLKMKHISGSAEDDISFERIPSDRDTKESASDYILGSVNNKVRDQLVTGLRRAKLKLLAWDIDILCYARAASLLWQRMQWADETRFVVVIGTNRTRLILLARDGRLFAPLLPVGIISFLEHLKTTFGEPAANPQWLDEKKITLSPTDTPEIRHQKILANQAIFTLYAPFAQQVKMHLYQTCSQYNIDLPRHFTVFGPGANLFRIANGLELDLGIKALTADWLAPERAASVGAALWDKHGIRVNCLPKGGGELLQHFKELLQTSKDKIQKLTAKQGKSTPSISFGSFNPVKTLTIGAVVFGVLAIYPAWKRISVSNELEMQKKEFESLGAKKDQILEFTNRQTTIEKRQALIKVLEEKRLPVEAVVKEVLFGLPSTIRLSGLNIKDMTVVIKGVSQTQEDLEQYLEACSRLRFLTDPTPTNVRREPNATSFEINLRIRGRDS